MVGLLRFSRVTSNANFINIASWESKEHSPFVLTVSGETNTYLLERHHNFFQAISVFQ